MDTERAAALKRENGRLRLDVAKLASSERIQEAAARLGLVLPAPGEVRYLKARPGLDARRAARRITEPTDLFSVPAPAAAVPPVTAGATTPGTTTAAPVIDPVTGNQVDPYTGDPIDPAAATPPTIDPVTGNTVDPATGAPIDPATGAPLAASTPPAAGTQGAARHTSDRPGHDRHPHGVVARPPRRPSRPRRVPVRLVERRIGLLFTLFLVLLALAGLRAVWIGTVKAGSLSERAVSQQVEDLTVNARRGTIFDRNGVELAVSEDAVTVFANPFLIDDPVARGGEARPADGRRGGRAAREALRPQTGLRLPAPQDGRHPRREGGEARDRGDRDDDRAQAHLSPAAPGLAGARHGGHRQLRALGAGARPRGPAGRGERRAPDGQGRARGTREHGGDQARRGRSRTCTSRSTRPSRSAPRRCWPRWDRPTRRRGPPRW